MEGAKRNHKIVGYINILLLLLCCPFHHFHGGLAHHQASTYRAHWQESIAYELLKRLPHLLQFCSSKGINLESGRITAGVIKG